MDKLLAFLALATLVAFLGILAVWVPSPDLVAVILLTLGLVTYDFVTSSRKKD
jgi:hypothetical protein